MLKIKNFGKALLSISALMVSLYGGYAQAANFNNMSFQPNYPENHPVSKNVFFPFYDKVKIDLNNNASFNHFSNGQLYPESDSYNVLNDGRVDFGVLRTGFFPGKMEALNFLSIPGLVPNALIGSLVTRDAVQKFPELLKVMPQNSVPFTIWSSAQNQIHANTPITSLEDIKGKKLIVWTADTMEIAKALGANPIRLSPPDTYLSLSKGMADGVLCPNAPLLTFKISEVAKHHYLINLNSETFSMGVFNALWNDFPPEYQEYFKKAGYNMSEEIGIAFLEGEQKDIKFLKENGHTIITSSDADKAKIDELFAPKKQEWVDFMQSEGYANAPEILSYIEERVEFYSDEYNKGTYGSYILN